MARAHLANGGLRGMSGEGLCYVYMALVEELLRRHDLPPGRFLCPRAVPDAPGSDICPDPVRCTAGERVPTSFYPPSAALRCTRTGHRCYPCPIPGCTAVLPSPSYVTQHLTLVGAHAGMPAWVQGQPVEFYCGPNPSDKLPCSGLVGRQALVNPSG
ncbi:hypothetical protein WJX84_004583 [Apatococcus fuscideae]|uniref:Uncharacterized protein n=1 Tax=Apatococcus fuscideae TaxID=2026836 RepID=A0AAW1T4Z0_9CHLO